MPILKPRRYTLDEIRAALIERNAEHEPAFYLLCTEAQCVDLAAGFTPLVVQAMARSLLAWEDQDRRRSERPVKTTTKKSQTRVDRVPSVGHGDLPRETATR